MTARLYTFCTIQAKASLKTFQIRGYASERNCKLLVVGGGAGGCSIAAKFASKLGKDAVVVSEPSEKHYYQPMLTLVGGGMKKLSDAEKPMGQVLPKQCDWMKEAVVEVVPGSNYALTSAGTKVNYEYLVVAAGLTLHYDKIPGLVEALSMPDSGVCSNYSPKYAQRTFAALNNFKEGNLIFTFPNSPVKCAGAPQKICYIAEHYLRLNGKREKARVTYNTSLGVIFGVKKYADELWKICEKRGIDVNLRTSLIEVRPHENIALFTNLDKPDHDPISMKYSVLHVTPPMSAPPVVSSAPLLADAAGFLDVDKHTLQHRVFPNVFGIGDCTSAPTAKTAAAVAAQCGVLEVNLGRVMRGELPVAQYDGYTSCPLVTGYSTCILAEFDYALQPLETFPVDQGKERALMFHMKKSIMPALYWNLMLRGYWNGPQFLRKIINSKG